MRTAVLSALQLCQGTLPTYRSKCKDSWHLCEGRYSRGISIYFVLVVGPADGQMALFFLVMLVGQQPRGLYTLFSLFKAS